jgi:hypothetical protein
MAIATASTMLSRFDRIIQEKWKKKTSVETVAMLRDKCVTADHFLDFVDAGRPTDPDARPSRIQRLKRLVHGSPKLKELFKQIKECVLPDEVSTANENRFEKLLLTEEFPLISWMWDRVLNFLHIPTQVLHSSLSETERDRVVKDFKHVPKNGDFSHLTVLILMYTINASGVNLDKDCHRVIVNTAASSTPVEVQAFSRVIRVSPGAAALQPCTEWSTC